VSIPSPYDRYQTVVAPEWVDVNDHMNAKFYYFVFYDAGIHFATYLGLGEGYPAKHGKGQAVVESHTTFQREFRLGDKIGVRSYLLGFDHKRIHFFHEMINMEDGGCAATMEQLELHVDLTARRSTTFSEDLIARFSDVAAAHANCARSNVIGRAVTPTKQAAR